MSGFARELQRASQAEKAKNADEIVKRLQVEHKRHAEYMLAQNKQLMGLLSTVLLAAGGDVTITDAEIEAAHPNPEVCVRQAGKEEEDATKRTIRVWFKHLDDPEEESHE